MNVKPSAIALLTFSALFMALLPSPRAFGAADYISLQERAQGQSLSGGNVLNDSLFNNPAGSTFTQVYAVQADMLSLRNFSASVLDTKNSGLSGGLAYFRRENGFNGPLTHGGRLNISTRASESLGMGVTGKYVAGYELLSMSEASLTDFDVGMLANFNFMQLGLTVRNLFGGNAAMDLGRELVAAMRFVYQNQLFFSASATAQYGFNPKQVGVGMEYVSPYYFALKGGFYFLPNTPFSSFTGGLSFISPKLSLHYAVEFPNLRREMLHQIGMTLLL